MACFNGANLTPAELEDLAYLRTRRNNINSEVEASSLYVFAFLQICVIFTSCGKFPLFVLF